MFSENMANPQMRGYQLILFFGAQSLFALVTYLLFLNICSRSREHSPRLQSGQNFSESWNLGNIFLAQFSRIFSPQEGNNAVQHLQVQLFLLNCSSDNLILIHSHVNFLIPPNFQNLLCSFIILLQLNVSLWLNICF